MEPKGLKNGLNQKTGTHTNTQPTRSLGPVPDLERHLPPEWWKTLFNSLYLKTDGDVVENAVNTDADINLLLENVPLSFNDHILDVCCGQGRHSLALARRGFHHIHGIDRSKYLIRLARKRARRENLPVNFSEGDARQLRLPPNSKDCIIVMGNSFGYFEREEDDVAVIKSISKVLKSQGKLVLDLVNGTWMQENFQPRSWEWIDQFHFVNRERSLSSDRKRIITREVITHAERGIIADQFYAERLYTKSDIEQTLANLGFSDIHILESVESNSTRNQDLGMMAHRMFVTCVGPIKAVQPVQIKNKVNLTVLFGDPKMPDKVKLNGQFNPEDFATIQKLKDALSERPEYKLQYLDNHETLLKQLIQSPPEFVFNLCDEGYRNDATYELHIPAILEMLNIPYTGAGPGCLALCYNKSKVRAIAQSMDIPVPLETYFRPDDQAANIPAAFPALLKPVMGDSSIGITKNAVVNNAVELVQYIEFLRNLLPKVPILVQEFLSGKEYSVGIVGNAPDFEALPILEVDYSRLPSNLPPILSYESKWEVDSPYWNSITYFEAEIDEDLKSRLINYSKILFEIMECRDYARFDFRCDSAGVPKLLEVNPNPGWCWDGKMNIMAGFARMSYSDLINKIVQAGLERVQLKSN